MYKSEPIVVRELFDDDTYGTIKRFASEWGPLIHTESDLDEKSSPFRFGRKWSHNTAFFVDIHHQLSEYASELFGEKVKPSYVFFAMYQDKGQCPLHLDRPQCRFTIDYLIQQQDKKPWPIYVGPQMSDKELQTIKQRNPDSPLEVQNVIDAVQWTEIELNPNDAVCYSGTHSWHYRSRPSKGKADLVFFHFVPWSFNGPLE